MLKCIHLLIITLLFVGQTTIFAFDNLNAKHQPNNYSPLMNNNENITPQTKDYLLEFELNNCDISPEAIRMGINAYQYLNNKGSLNNPNYLTIIDFSKPSTEERFFLIDMNSKKVVLKTLVAHGVNTGDLYATEFSNINDSYQSSLGAYITNETYIGVNGLSLKIDGVEEGINSNARLRRVVVHSANYVSYDYIKEHGKLGNSQGCPALPKAINDQIIEMIKDGSCLFIYHPTECYKAESVIYQSMNEAQIQTFLATKN